MWAWLAADTEKKSTEPTGDRILLVVPVGVTEAKRRHCTESHLLAGLSCLLGPSLGLHKVMIFLSICYLCFLRLTFFQRAEASFNQLY